MFFSVLFEHLFIWQSDNYIFTKKSMYW